MGVFDRLKNSRTNHLKEWHDLNDINQLHEIVEESSDKPVVIFKHSTTCGISFRAKHGLESQWDFEEKDMKFYYLDLLTYRPISNEVANRFGVVHQSPQIIVIKDGEAVFSTSHHAISVPRLKSALADIEVV